jgi:site-specific recombinase XerD
VTADGGTLEDLDFSPREVIAAMIERGFPTALKIRRELKLYCSRHTFATVVIDATKNPYVVMQGMGHEELDTTMLYMHNDVMQLKAVIDKRNDSKLVP